MTEQKTMQLGLEVAKEWGPEWTAIILLLILGFGNLIWSLWSNRKINSPVNEQRRLLSEVEKRVSKVELELEKRCTYDWVEDHLKEYPRKDVVEEKHKSIEDNFSNIKNTLDKIWHKLEKGV